MDSGVETPRELPIQEIVRGADTRDVLAHAKTFARKRDYDDYLIIDVDSHHYETQFWDEVVEYIPDEIVRFNAKSFMRGGKLAPTIAQTAAWPNYQNVNGRIPHGAYPEEMPDETDHRSAVLARRAMDTMGVDYQVVFPSPLLTLGLHRERDVEANLTWAYNKWISDRICRQEPRVKSLLFLPFNDPVACERIVAEMAEEPGVAGAMVTSVRHKAVHANEYMRLYAMLEERGMPLMFHAGPHWEETGYVAQLNRFIGAHAISFVLCNMVHLTNWVLNGLPERFPKLKVGWIESGISWIGFMCTRLDNEYLMRSSEAPALKRLPSEYISDMFFTTQPMETTNMKLLEANFDAFNAKTQLLYSSDWPHWDFDLPGTVFDLPFLDEAAKRNILGLNAARLFGIEEKVVKPRVGA